MHSEAIVPPPIPRRDARQVPSGAALRPLALIAIAYGALSTYADPDLWAHVRFGLDILDNGGVVTGPDRYSFTADRPFVYHEWLGGTLMAGAFRLAGPAGLVALKAILATIPSAATWYLLRHTQFMWRWLGTAAVAWGTLGIALTVRPQLWTVIGIVVVGVILTRGSNRTLMFLPPLFALWANLHGGWIVGGGILAIWAAVACLKRSPLRWPLLVAGGACLMSTLLTPYGLDLWSFLVETVRFGRDDISEWQPAWRTFDSGLFWALTVALIAYSWRQHGRPEPAALLSLVFLAFAAARVNRIGPLFTVATVILLSHQWPRDHETLRRERATPGRNEILRTAFELCGIAAFIVITWTSGMMPRCISLKNGPDYRAAEALRGTRGRLVTFFDYGGYALWHFGPGLKVSLDGRRETLYSMRVLHEQYAIANGTPEGLQALERIRPDYVWLPTRSSATARWLRANGYREEIRTEDSFVAVRSDLPRLPQVAIESSGCYPGP